MVGAYLAKGLVRSGSLLVNYLILLRPLAHKNLGGKLRGHMPRQPPYSPLTLTCRTWPWRWRFPGDELPSRTRARRSLFAAVALNSSARTKS